MLISTKAKKYKSTLTQPERPSPQYTSCFQVIGGDHWLYICNILSLGETDCTTIYSVFVFFFLFNLFQFIYFIFFSLHWSFRLLTWQTMGNQYWFFTNYFPLRHRNSNTERREYILREEATLQSYGRFIKLQDIKKVFLSCWRCLVRCAHRFSS